MRQRIALSPQHHRSHYWRTHTDLAFCRKWASIPIVAAEIDALIPIVPIAFQPNTTESGFDLIALLSPLPDRNLFLKPDNTWVAGYVPALLRMYPFSPGLDTQNDRSLLCIDSAALTPEAEAGRLPLFDTEGQLTPQTARFAAIAAEFDKAYRQTSAAVASLNHYGLIVPWPLKLTGSDNREVLMSHVYHVDAKALRQLDASALKALNESGALQIAYAQLLSEQRATHFSRLIRMQTLTDAVTGSVPDITSLFAKQDETLKFDF